MEPINIRRRNLLETPHTQSEVDGIFSTDMVAPLESLEVTLEPKQEGSGTPAPDNVRPISGKTQVAVTQRGKNLFNKNAVTPSNMTCYTSSGDSVTRNGVEYHLPAGTYTLRCHSETIYTYVYMNVLDSNGDFVSFASLSMGAAAGWRTVTVTLTDGQYLVIFKGTTTTLDLSMDLQIELGTEATDYTPFVEGGNTVLGKNLFNYENCNFISGIRDSSGEYQSDNNSGYTANPTPVNPSTTYTLSGSKLYSSGYVVRIYYLDENGDWISRTGGEQSSEVHFTTPSNCHFIQIQTKVSGADPSTWQLEYGSTATTYEPYAGLGYVEDWGKNMIGGLTFANQVKKVMPDATLNTTNQTVSFSGRTTSTDSIEIVGGIFKPNTRYTFINIGTTGNYRNFRWGYTDGTIDSQSASKVGAYVSSASKSVLGLFKVNNNSTAVVLSYEQCGIFEGVWSEDDFEPYVGEVYKGTVDVASGKLTVTHKLATLDGSESWSLVNGGFYVDGILTGCTELSDGGSTDFTTNLYQVTTAIPNSSYVPSRADFSFFNQRSYPARVWVKDSTYETAEDFKAALATQNLQIFYPLANPEIFNISPVQVMSLPKDNVFLSEDGSITYTTHWRHMISLPSAYQRIRYLESTGTQYINTGKLPTDNTRMQLKYYTTSNGSFYCAGARSGASTIYFAQSGATSGAKVSCTVNGTSVTAQDSGGVDFKRVSSGQLFEIMIQTNTDSTYDYSIVDYTHNKYFRTTGVSYTPMGVVSNPIYLFALNTSYVVSGTNRCYYFKLYRDGRIILDGVPCYRKSDGVAGLYDLVTGTFFTNSGTGEFVKGPDI